MSNREYKNLAIDKVINILKEYDLKYRRLDFDNDDNQVMVIDNLAIVQLSFLYGIRGKRLKSLKKKFKDYSNVKLAENYIVFNFNFEELNKSENVEIITNKSIDNSSDDMFFEDKGNEELSDNFDDTENEIKNISDISDIIIMENIAKKHGMTLTEFAKNILVSNVRNIRATIRFTKSESLQVDEKAKKLGMSRSRFTRYVCNHFIKNYKDNINISNVSLDKIRESKEIIGEGERKQRVCFLFSDVEEYEKLRRFADNLGIPFSVFIRYCTLLYDYTK